MVAAARILRRHEFSGGKDLEAAGI